jgi:UDP-N-acetylmuramoyl-L-alanyl-D-glutamate--2,6-diaminopimelate ligase
MGYHIISNLRGKYNVSNILAAFSCFFKFNKSNVELILEGIENLKFISGRMNIVHTKPIIIIDFAHTPNAFYNSLKSINEDYKTKDNKIWVIFGAAGERDTYKRPVMGKHAFSYCDNILVTLEDCRSESLYKINNEIIEGFKYLDDSFTIDTYYPEFVYERSENKFVMRFDEPSINSRKNAIKFAINNASQEDIIVILGKGHETTMNVGGIEYPWSDKEVVAEYL